MSENTPVKLAILWHMHQPDYRDFKSKRMVLPWVRLHALKDYLDMPLMAAKYDSVKVTFNLVPSLLDQLERYLKGDSDPHLDLTVKDAEILTPSEKLEILATFFSAPTDTMIKPHRRYFELFRKAKENQHDKILSALFTSSEMRDIQVWSNLVWIDPMFRKEEPIASLFAKHKHFTEAEKQAMIAWQMQHIGKIIPTYQKLYKEGKIDVSFTPYYHPILPLLCDSHSAQEALPNITLPKKRFVHPEDAKKQIEMSVQKYSELFGKKMPGMWPSEGSVSEETARLIAESNINWIATDEEILQNSIKKSGQSGLFHPHQLYNFDGLKIYFRDHSLSDRVGFVYSGMDPDKAVTDFIEHLLAFRNRYRADLDKIVIPVILDGENAWEYFDNDGYEFLDKLYYRLSQDPLIETINMSDYAANNEGVELKSLFAGSWINHNFKIWIGHHEDNRAWDLLSRARDTIVEYTKAHPELSDKIVSQVWDQIYVAEGSDWCWWYGDEHRGEHNRQFDQIFRQHLIAVYEILELPIPDELYQPIHRDDAGLKAVMPDDLLTPVIDGKRTHFYEWTQAGYFDAANTGGAMHQVSKLIDKIYFAYDHERFYCRLDFSKLNFKLKPEHKINVVIENKENFNIEIEFGKYNTKEEDHLVYAFEEILEIAIDRTSLLEEGHGTLRFAVDFYDGEQKLESIPESEPIELQIPQKDQEIFWVT